MDFPDFDNDIQVNDDTTNHNHFGNNINDIYQVPSFPTNQDFGMGGVMNSMDWASPIDEEELKRQEARRVEEEERRNKLNEKIRRELEGKQENRQRAMEWTQRWEDQRQNNIKKKKEFNRLNEEEYLKNRETIKEGKTNPWDKVIENIQLKDGDHKGLRDVSRMKAVILQRKADFVNMKMK